MKLPKIKSPLRYPGGKSRAACENTWEGKVTENFDKLGNIGDFEKWLKEMKMEIKDLKENYRILNINIRKNIDSLDRLRDNLLLVKINMEDKND